jgi:hypothetical protein
MPKIQGYTKGGKKRLFRSERIKLRCKQCHGRLCDRVLMDKGWMLHFKKGRTNLYAPWVVMTCATCNTSHRIDREKGIIQSERHPYTFDNYDARVQAKTGESTNNRQQ